MEFLRQIKDPPREYSAAAFWFWNGELKPEKLRGQIDEMVEKGVYQGFMHSRAYLKTPYLEQPWWDAVSACVERGKEAGFYPWLYDEYAWPSGTAGSTFPYGDQKPSRVLSEGEQNMAKGLYFRTYACGEAAMELAKSGETPIAVFLLRGRGDLLTVSEWDASKAGTCEKESRVIAFYRQVYPLHVDYLNPDTIKAFLSYTHEEYRKRYGEEFGKVIPGVFFDEIYMVGRPFPWTDRLPMEFEARRGYPLLPALPFLMEAGGEEGRRVRRDYYQTIGELYEEAFFKQISHWCEKYGLQLTGHTEEGLLGHPGRQGNFFNTVRHLQIPGADCHDYRYRFPRKITYVEPKYAVSVAREYGKKRAMSEAMGGAGWGCSLQQFKRGINTMGAMGINFFTLHGFYYECDTQGSQADWPTSFFYQNPYWKYFKAFSDYMRRVCYFNASGKPVVEVGLYYPIEEIQEETVGGSPSETALSLSRAFHQTLNGLLEKQIDVDMVDAQGILKGVINDGTLAVGDNTFRVLFLPCAFRPIGALREKLAAFGASGGKLLFYRCGDEGAFPEGLSGALCDAGTAPKALGAVLPLDVRVIEGSSFDLFVSHRLIEGADCYFVANGGPRPRCVTLFLRAMGNLSKLDLETGHTQPIPGLAVSGGTQVRLDLSEDEGCVLCFGGEKRDAVRYEDVEQVSVPGKWSFLPLPREYDACFGTKVLETRMEIPNASFSSSLHPASEEIRICNREGEPGRCGRHLSLWRGGWITRRPTWRDNCVKKDLYFQKTLFLSAKPTQARFCVAAVNECDVSINGEKAASLQSALSPLTLDVASWLREGENLLALHVHNENPLPDDNLCSVETLPPDRIIGLLLEGEILAGGERITVTSDESFWVCDQALSGWEKTAWDFGMVKKADACRYANLGQGEPDGSVLNAWMSGRPPMLPWGNLPLYGESVPYPVRLAYLVTLPAGTRKVETPEIQGEWTAELDGMPAAFEDGALHVTGDGRSHILTLRVIARGPEDGLKKPLSVILAPFDAPLGDWRQHGLGWFSGRALYRNRLTLLKKEGRYILHLGQACFGAEIYVNRELVTVRVWAPYCADVTDFLRDGENEVAIVVANSAAVERRHMLVDEGMALGWDRYWNEDNIDREGENLMSGLFGPIWLYRKLPADEGAQRS